MGQKLMQEPFMQTYTGKTIKILDPDPDMICIQDIAHHLALINRYCGATLVPYSVAQHSVLVSNLCSPEDALWGLMHDSAEAYVQDIQRPLKQLLGTAYSDIEDRFLQAIANHFGLTYPMPSIIKTYDNIALLTERRDLMLDQGEDWGISGVSILPGKIVDKTWNEVEMDFVLTFLCTGGRV